MSGTAPLPGMSCPRCRVDLAMTGRQGTEIDYCPKCRGVWLDRGELDKIIERSAALEAAVLLPGQAESAEAPWPPQPAPSFLPPPNSYAQPANPYGHGGEHGAGHGRGHDFFLGRLFG